MSLPLWDIKELATTLGVTVQLDATRWEITFYKFGEPSGKVQFYFKDGYEQYVRQLLKWDIKLDEE